MVSIPYEKYCDGVYPPDCIDKSDESNCSDTTHFYCENGDPLFVPRSKVLDGKRDCSDFSDECPPNLFDNNALSSREELIKSSFLKVLIWFMAFFAIVGNVSVLIITFVKLRRFTKEPAHSRSNINVLNNILILNLAVADFFMGIVLFTLAVKTAQFSGNYCHEDKPWRTSSLCISLGVMTVISSEASVLTLVCITSYRLYVVYKPIGSQRIRLWILAIWICFIWFCSFLLAFLPLANSLSSSMITHMLISQNPYFSSDTVTLHELRHFTNRLASFKNVNISKVSGNWYETNALLQQMFSTYAPSNRGYFGYYSHSGVCMPSLYRISVEDPNTHPLSSAIISFNFVALLYIAAAYFAIYRRSVGSRVTSSGSQAKARKMYRKITVLIITDMCCWFPVCIMTFLSMSGVVLSPTAYAASAVVLLPINSSLNPVIYAAPLEALRSTKFMQRLRQRRQKRHATRATQFASPHKANTTNTVSTSADVSFHKNNAEIK